MSNKEQQKRKRGEKREEPYSSYHGSELNKLVMQEISSRPEVRAIRAKLAQDQKTDDWRKAHSLKMKAAWKRKRGEGWNTNDGKHWVHQNRVEEMFKAQGYEILRRGWPDFICIKGDEIKLIEAKGPNFRLTKLQIRVQEILRKQGFEVETIRTDMDGNIVRNAPHILSFIGRAELAATRPERKLAYGRVYESEHPRKRRKEVAA